MSALLRKLFRDLSSLRGQVLTISLVVACGISSYITMRTAYDSLVYSKDHYYEQYRFADVFAALKRAPRTLKAHLEAIDGVARVDTRVVEQVLVPVEGMARPTSGTIVGLDHREQGTRLNDVHITEGRMIDPTKPDEILLLLSFAEAHKLEPGDKLNAVINGTLRPLKIVGLALSPEYVMAVAPGALSYDPATVPVIWMDERSLAAAFQMEGSFNNVSFQLQHNANTQRVLSRVDALLARYGGFGAVARAKQTSNFMLQGELTQLNNMAGFVPYLFLFVAALLVNVVLSRLVQLQRPQIATLKAIGYPDTSIGFHYLQLVSVIVVIGAILGVAFGAWFGHSMMDMYTGEYFRFPDPEYRLEPQAVLFSVGISVGSAVVGAWWSVKRVVSLPPAEAMRPPAPARYRRSVFELVGLWRFLDPEAKMIWRELSRRPARLALSAVGISLATGLVVVSRSMWDGVEHLIDVQFHRSMREDMNATFAKPLPDSAISDLEHVPGVFYAEGLRNVPVRFQNGHLWRDSVLIGYPKNVRLRRLLDSDATPHPVPEHGVLLTTKLGEVIGLKVGDLVEVQLRQGNWHKRKVPVSGFVDEPFGLQGHISMPALNRLMGDDGAVDTALMRLDSREVENIEQRLKKMPWVAAVASPKDFKRQFDEQSVAIMNVFTLIMTIFAIIIAIGVIYNNARVALSQRTRDFASLRVLGFTRREIAAILFGEQTVQVALAIPLGLVFGRWMGQAMMSNADAEMYRFPVVIAPRTYVFAAAVTLLSAVASALILRRKIHRIDLIGALKTRE